MMTRALACVALLTLSLSALAEKSLPRDVQMFIDRREGCDHMRAELPDPGEKQHAKEVSREIVKLCKGTDKRLAQLKKKYASDAVVVQRLNEFEDITEVSVAPASSKKAKQKGS
jgi:hypothetical protein